MILAVKYIKDENKVYLINTDFMDSGMKTVNLETAEALVDRLENDFQLDYYRRSLGWVLSVPVESQERMLLADGYYDEQLQRWRRVRVLTTFGRKLSVTTTQLNSLFENKANAPLYQDLRLFKYLETRKVTQVHILCGEGCSIGDYEATGIVRATNKTPTKTVANIFIEDHPWQAIGIHTPIMSQNCAPCFLEEGNAKLGSSTLSMLGVLHEDYQTNNGESKYERLAQLLLTKGIIDRDETKEETALETYRKLSNVNRCLFPVLNIDSILSTVKYLEAGYDSPYPIYLLPLLSWLNSQYGNYQMVGTSLDTRVYKNYIDQVVARDSALSLFMETDGRELGEVIAFGDKVYGYKLNESNFNVQGQIRKAVIDIRGYTGVTPFALLGHAFIPKYFWISNSLKNFDISNYKGAKLLIDGIDYSILNKVVNPNYEKLFNLNYYRKHTAEFVEVITHLIYSQMLNVYTQQHLSPVETNIDIRGKLAEFIVANGEAVENTRVTYYYNIAVLGTSLDLCIGTYYGDYCSVCVNDKSIGSPASPKLYDPDTLDEAPLSTFGLSRLLLSHVILALGLTRYTGETETYKIVGVEWLPFSCEADNYQLFGNKAVFVIGKNKVIVTLDKAVPIVTKYKTLQIGVLNNNEFFDGEETDMNLYTECLDRIQAVLLENKYPVGKTVELRSQECEDTVSEAIKLYSDYRDDWRRMTW